jgi:hypothetical protein
MAFDAKGNRLDFIPCARPEDLGFVERAGLYPGLARQLLLGRSITSMRTRTLILVVAGLAAATPAFCDPELLTWDELVTLYEQDQPPAPLAQKLHILLTTPFVSN